MTPTPTPGLANASNAVVNGFGSMEGLAGPVVLIVWAVLIIAVMSAARSNEYFQHIVDALGVVAESVVYFLHGAAFLAVLAVVMAPAYFVATADPGTRQTVGTYVGIALGVYVAITVVGYLAKEWVIDPIRTNVSEALPEPDETDESVEVSD